MIEYEACLFGLEALIAVKVEEVEVIGDPKLVIKHANGSWEVKEDRLKSYIDYLHIVIQNFKRVTFTHTSRVNNRVPNALANLASTWEEISVMPKKPIMMSSGSIPCYEGERIMDIEEEERPWVASRVMQWMSKRVYLDSTTRDDRRTLQCLALQFVVLDGQLYKRMLGGVLLRCVSMKVAEGIMEQIHARVRGTYMNEKVLAKKILKQGFFGRQWKGIVFLS
ncbi:uncharacterized protein LOC105643769 [Jatropha curcas]|uniref:uncharacterized protein LOC105643769 n=1 Tax=Jatropha curcas TaxID=180498 RepID=UPI0005FBE622|nr:uncharacterized protein LOC105643769 [Jatropha curcas]